MSDETFRWQLVDDFIHAFNQHRASNFNPCGTLCVDESIIRWYGLGGHWISVGLPHYVCIDRKPEDGCEIQDICCAETGILCRLKIVKTSTEKSRINEANANANSAPASPTRNGNGNHNDAESTKINDQAAGTQSVLELTEPWHATNRIIVGDSAFSSVNTAVQLTKRRLGYIGVVKQATRRFPMSPLSETILPVRGQYTGMSTKINGTTYMAYVWSDRERRYFISTAGSMAQGEPYRRIRWTEVGDEDDQRLAQRLLIQVPMPRASEMYFDACGMIDSHNRIREMCGIDRRIRTRNWATRVNFSILSMIFVDAFLLYKACCGQKAKLNPKEYFEKLAAELIDLQIDGIEGTTTRGGKRKRRDRPAQRNEGILHRRTTRKKHKTQHSKQGRCVVCKSHTTFVCSRCSNLNKKDDNVYVCKKDNRACWWSHVSCEHCM